VGFWCWSHLRRRHATLSKATRDNRILQEIHPESRDDHPGDRVLEPMAQIFFGPGVDRRSSTRGLLCTSVATEGGLAASVALSSPRSWQLGWWRTRNFE